MTARRATAAVAVAVALLATGCRSPEAPGRSHAVAVEGIAQEVIAEWAFVLAEQPGQGGALLVIDPRASRVRPGDIVRVTGALRRFAVSEASEAFGRELDVGLFARFEGKTYVQADLVESQADPAGSSTENRAPPSGLRDAVTVAPISRTVSRTMARPSPAPCCDRDGSLL